MPLHLQLIFYIGINILMLYIVNTALNIYLQPKKQSIYKIFTYVIYMIGGIITHFLIRTPLVNMTLTASLVYIIATNFESSKKNRVAIACYWLIFIMITELAVSICYVSILNQDLNAIVSDEITNIIATIIHALVLLIIVKSVGMYVNKQALSEKITIFDSLYVCIIPVCSIMILYFFLQISLIYSVQYFMVIVSCLLIIFINVFFFVLFDKIRFSEKLKYENALLKNQAEYFSKSEENAKETFEKVQIVKHDLKYQLLHLKAKTEEKAVDTLDEITKILDSMIEDVLSDKQALYTKNQGINRLLNYKLSAINERGVDIDITASIREDAYIDEISLYTILGNAIDNANRNFDSSKSELKTIIIRVIDDNDNLFIKIANPYNKKLKFKNGLPLTDKENKELHGIGLQSIKNLVEQKNGHFKITTVDNVFILEILLYEEIKYINSHQD